MTDTPSTLTAEPATPQPDPTGEFVQRVLSDVTSGLTFLLAGLGDRHGLFQALVDRPETSSELAERTHLDERYLREWLAALAAAGYLTYDPAGERFTLPPAHVPVLAIDATPASVGGYLQWMLGVTPALDAVSEAFRTGRGVPPARYGRDFWPAMERIGAGLYATALVDDWLARLPRTQARLAAGANVLDIGCGSGRALVTLAQAYPASRFTGIDALPTQIERARANADAAGVSDRVAFQHAQVIGPGPGNGMPSAAYDLVLAFDVLHDAADPAAILATARRSLRPDGILLCLELAGGATLTDNLTPMGQVYYAVSLLYCLPASLDAGGPGLGSLGLTQTRLDQLATEAGFARVNRLADVPPGHVVYEVLA